VEYVISEKTQNFRLHQIIKSGQPAAQQQVKNMQMLEFIQNKGLMRKNDVQLRPDFEKTAGKRTTTLSYYISHTQLSIEHCATNQVKKNKQVRPYYSGIPGIHVYLHVIIHMCI
jgi:adenine deaminase